MNRNEAEKAAREIFADVVEQLAALGVIIRETPSNGRWADIIERACGQPHVQHLDLCCANCGKLPSQHDSSVCDFTYSTERGWERVSGILCDEVDPVTLAQHTKYVEEFLCEMYATMIDPCEQPRMKVAELCKLLLETAREQGERAGGQDAVLCAAKHSDTGANDPQDCDWPFCGCDPKADKVIEAIQESGFTLVKDEDLLKMTRAGDRACGETSWVSVDTKVLTCPKCEQPLKKVEYPSDSMLNRDQWMSVRAGDYYCTCHNNHTGNRPYAYFWEKDLAALPSPPTAEE